MATADPNEIRAWIRLATCPGARGAPARALLNAFGPPEAFVDAPTQQLARIVGGDVARALRTPADSVLEAVIESGVAWAQEPGHHFLSLGDPHYPSRLLQTPDPPLVLYAEGDALALDRPLFAILLSPQSNAEGVSNAVEFARALDRKGAVLLWDEDVVLRFPNLARDVVRSGVAVATSATAPGATSALSFRSRVAEHPGPPTPSRQRPRGGHGLLAGLCRALLVVQGARQSDVYATARLAGEFGREVFAIPGSIHSPLSKASHRLIKDGAKLVESSEDIFSELAPFSEQA